MGLCTAFLEVPAAYLGGTRSGSEGCPQRRSTTASLRVSSARLKGAGSVLVRYSQPAAYGVSGCPQRMALGEHPKTLKHITGSSEMGCGYPPSKLGVSSNYAGVISKNAAGTPKISCGSPPARLGVPAARLKGTRGVF